jgi:beta-lactamase class A
MQNNRLIHDISSGRQRQTRGYITPARQVTHIARTAPRSDLSLGPKLRIKPFILMLLIAVGGGMLATNISASGSEKSESPAVLAVAKEPSEELLKIDTVALQSKIDSIIAQYPHLQISVSYADIKSSDYVNTGVQAPYIAASTGKLLAAALFLSEVQKGTYRLDQSVGGAPAGSQLQLMIEKSDNASWNAFRTLLGHEALERYSKEIGMSSYHSESNTGSPSDIAVLLEKLYGNKLLNRDYTELLLSYMQNASESQYISAAVPQDSKVYHKAGYLQDRAHDAAIIDNGKQPFVLVIFTKANSGNYDFELGARIIHELTSAVLAAYPS